MVREMHNGLIAALDSEQATLVLVHVIKVNIFLLIFEILTVISVLRF